MHQLPYSLYLPLPDITVPLAPLAREDAVEDVRDEDVQSTAAFASMTASTAFPGTVSSSASGMIALMPASLTFPAEVNSTSPQPGGESLPVKSMSRFHSWCSTSGQYLSKSKSGLLAVS